MAMPDAGAGTGGRTGDETGRARPDVLDPVTVSVLVVAVVAISSSAVLVRWAEASALALAFWRTLGGSLILTVPAASARIVSGRTSGPRGGLTAGRPTGAQWRLMIVAGVALALHFATWLASLELTSVAASVTLVSTAPVMIAMWQVLRGRPPTSTTWLAIGLAAVGTVIITVGAGSTAADVDGQHPAVGNALALVGAAAMAVYLVAGASVRRHLPTTAYAFRTYAVAAVTLLVTSLVVGTDLVGFDTATWLVIGAMILGPQLAGHTGLNHLLRRLGSITVSLVLLAEPVAATVLAWLLLKEAPPAAVVVGGPLVIAAVALRLFNQDRTPAPPGSTG